MDAGAISVVNGGAITSEVAGSGAYVVVLRDAEGGTADLNIDEALPGAASPESLDLVAGGSVTPSKSKASVFADLVTAQARVAVTNRGGSLPSGLILVGDITERYQLRDGTRRFPPTYDEFLVGYRGLTGNVGAVEAQFPLRPVLLFGAEELMEATVRVDVSAPDEFLGRNFRNGRRVAGERGCEGARECRRCGERAGGVAAGIGSNELCRAREERRGRGRGRRVDHRGDCRNGRKIALDFGPQDTNSNYVLGKIVWRGGVYGVEPRERFQSDASGAFGEC